MNNDESKLKVVNPADLDSSPVKPKRSSPRLFNDLKKIITSKRSLQVIAVLLGLVVLRLGINFIFENRNQKVMPTLHYVHPATQPLDESLTLPANMEGIEQASLYSHVAGYLKKLYVDEGDTVKKGQLLADIDAPDIVDDYAKSKADLNFKAVTEKRYKELVDDKVISQQEYDNIDSAYEEAKARFNTAATNMEYTHIRAPFAGSIARRFKYPGDLISVSSSNSNQSPIFILVNESVLRVAINIPQSNIGDVHIGSPVDIKVDGLPNQDFKGVVSRMDALLDANTKTQRVLIDIDNSDGKLHAGMFGSVILHFQHKNDALTIPTEALEEQNNQSFVFVEKGGRVHKAPVTIGIKTQDKVEITNGLSVGDNVLLTGHTMLKDGLKIKAVPVASGSSN